MINIQISTNNEGKNSMKIQVENANMNEMVYAIFSLNQALYKLNSSIKNNENMDQGPVNGA